MMKPFRTAARFLAQSLLAVCLLAPDLLALQAPPDPPPNDPKNQAAAPAAAKPTVAGAIERQSQPTFGLDRLPIMRRELGGYPLWQYGAFLLWIIGAFIIAALIDFLMTHQLKKLTAKTKSDLDDRLLGISQKPVKIIVTLLVIQTGVHAFHWSEWAERLLLGGCAVGIAAAATFLVVKLVDVLVAFTHKKFFSADAELARLLLPILGRSLKVFIIIVAVLTTAQYLGLPITSIIAGLGIGGIAIALAAQNTLANVFGSITILADRPFRVGDRVKVDSHEGFIETIGLRSTRLRTLEGHLTVIPNKFMADSAIVNISARPNIRHLMTLNIPYGTSAEKMKLAVQTLRDIYKNHPLTHDAIVYWRDFGAHSLDILVIYWCKTTDFKEFLKANEEINMEIKRRFEAAGIEFAFPTQTVYLQGLNVATTSPQTAPKTVS